MTPKQRLYNLIEKKDVPDKQVLFHPILMQFAANFAGFSYEEFMTDCRVLVEANIQCLDAIGHDAVSVISDPFRETSAFGAKVKFNGNQQPVCEPIVNTMDDILKLTNPDVTTSSRTRDRIRGVAYFYKMLKNYYPIIGWIEGPLAESCDLAGVSHVLQQMVIEPDFVLRLMERCMVTAIDFAEAQIDAGSDVMGIGDAICSQISLDMYRQFVLPRHQELVELIHKMGAKVKLHICGNITHLLPALAETGVDILDLDWMVDMAAAREIVGPNMLLFGNLDPVNAVQNQSPDLIEDSCTRLINQTQNHPMILSAGCEITAATPVDNVKAMKNVAVNGSE